MPAHKGNKTATKLKKPDVRQEAYRQYCDHIASGLPKEAFFFDHPEHSLCWKTMERYIVENSKEFPSFLMEKARAARYKHWLGEGQKLMRGDYKGAPTVWQTCMRNIFKDIGWDQEQISEGNKAHVERIARGVRDSVAKTEDGDSEERQED